MNLRFLLICLFLLPRFFVIAQIPAEVKNYLDSLNATFDKEKKIDILLKLSSLTVNASFVDSYKYGQEAIRLSHELKHSKGLINAYNAVGDAYWFHADYGKAQGYYFKAYRICDSIHDKQGIAQSLFNIGWIICIQQRKYEDVHYFNRALKNFIEIGDSMGIGMVYNALGNMYNDKFNNFREKPSFDSSLKYYNAGIKIYTLARKQNKIPVFMTNIGELMSLSGDLESAIYYNEIAGDLFIKMQDSVGFELSQMNLGNYLLQSGKTDAGLKLLHEAYDYAKRSDNRDILTHVYEYLYKGYKQKNNSEKALFFLEKFKILNDSTQHEIYSSSILDKQNSYELEKKEANIKELTQANEIQELKTKQNRLALIGVGGVLVVIIIVAYLLYKQNKEKNKANLLLKEQNLIISQKKAEIESSIHYAKGIQTSFLPDITDLKLTFPDSFIFYRPKDVVSGDFYWFCQLNNYFYCLAADCTGHGVPGALMSIVSVDKISQALFEKKLTEPCEILSHINVEIKKALKQHDDHSKQKDGLDIALLRFDLNGNLAFSGANRPLYIVSEGHLEEYKADKVAIAGFTPDHYVFNQTEIKVKKGDNLYVFSDGYADQFGGDEGKKFMTKNFKNLLISAASKPMNQQEMEIQAAHYNWKGSYEQVDDILVIGIKI